MAFYGFLWLKDFHEVAKMTPFTKTVVISQPEATQSLLGVSHVYPPLTTTGVAVGTAFALGVSHVYPLLTTTGVAVGTAFALGVSHVDPPLATQNSFGFLEIQELVQNLSNLEGVESAESVYQNVRSVVFQIKLSALPEYESFDDDLEFEYEIESNNVDKVWDVAQDLVLKTCCHLRDITGEKWYFFTQIVEDFTNPLLDS